MRNKLIPELYEKLKAKVLDVLASCSAVTLSLDIWSAITMDGFIGFTLAGVTKDFVNVTFHLCVRQLTGRHTGEAIIAEFEDVVKDWNIPISSVTLLKLVLNRTSKTP